VCFSQRGNGILAFVKTRRRVSVRIAVWAASKVPPGPKPIYTVLLCTVQESFTSPGSPCVDGLTLRLLCTHKQSSC